MTSIGEPIYWVGFLVFVLAMLALDLLVFNRKAHVVGMKEALVWSLVWITLSMCFAGLVWWKFGDRRALEFLTGWVVEKALSVDNIFVFIVLFGYFAVPEALRHRILFWGILGALILRAIFIVIGAEMLHRFHWLMYGFGGFLVFTAIKLMFKGDGEDVDPEKNFVLKIFRRFVRMTSDFRGGKFFVTENGRSYATPLLLVLVVVEVTDLLFAMDSIPAVFGVSQDPFIIFTSNIFAILGLRALFFVVGGIMGKFRFLDKGLAFVLAFVGAKMILHSYLFVPIGLSLGIIGALLGGAIILSQVIPPPPEAKPPATHDPLAGATTIPPKQ